MTPKSAKSRRAIEMMAATSIAHDKGFHMYPRNRRKGLTVDSGNLLGPYCSSRLVCSAVVKPFPSHCRAKEGIQAKLLPLVSWMSSMRLCRNDKSCVSHSEQMHVR